MKLRTVGLLLCSMFLSVILALPVGAVTHSQAKIGFTGGTITFSQAPSISFGSHEMQATLHRYPATTVRDSARLLDARGSQAGWEIRANLSAFENNGAEILKGSSMMIKPAVPMPVNSNGPPPTGQQSEVELLAGDGLTHAIWVALPGEGSGQWNMKLQPQDVALKVPGDTAEAGSYHATLEWTLIDAPSS